MKQIGKRMCMVALVIVCALFAAACNGTTGNEGAENGGKAKGESFAPTDLHEKMFEAKMSSWGEVSSVDDYHAYTNWVVYYDGTVEKYSFYHISGYTDKSVWKMSDAEFAELTELLTGKFQKKQKEVDASDGDGWSMTYFDEAGNPIYSYDGYIYGLETMELIEEIIDYQADKEVTQEEYIYESHEQMLRMSIDSTALDQNENVIQNGEWILYYDGKIETTMQYASEDTIETHEYKMDDAGVQKIQELLEANFVEILNGEESDEMWCFESYNILGDDINFFYGDIKGIDFLEEIREIIYSYCDE